jgi:hypothetical protein
MERSTIKCPRCGLEVARLVDDDSDTTEIDGLAYAKMCLLAPERAAFDFECPALQGAIATSRRDPSGNKR